MVEPRSALTAAMDRYADGEDAAFAEVYDLLAPRLYAFFLRHTASTSAAEDLVQQTMLHMHAARLSFLRGSDPTPWAFAIGRRLLIDSRRRSRREVLFDTPEDAAEALDSKIERFAVPEGIAISREDQRRAMFELSRMPAAHREAYIMIREEGLSLAQTAALLHTTQTAVKLRAHRAYEALRAALANDEGLEEVRR